MVYRRPSQYKRGVSVTCGKPECKSQMHSGENNPFWGKSHSAETLEKIKATKRARPRQNRYGPKKGSFRHTPEARAKMSEALRERWKANRDKMLSHIPRGEEHPYHKAERERRYRVCFTRFQKRDWQDNKCFYCGATDDLVLDHIIPVMAGGKNLKPNAQTLCGPCNRWKMRYVDLPYYLATLGSEGG